MTIEVCCITAAALVSGALFGAAWGYHAGKCAAFSSLRSHQMSGRSLETALDYEEDVNEGRVPRR